MSIIVPRLSVLQASEVCSFTSPVKRINQGHDVSRFLRSKAYHDIMVFLLQLNRAVFACRLSDPATEERTARIWKIDSPQLILSETVRQIRALLVELNAIIDDVPPDPGPRRFGNVSFRRWYDAVEGQLPTLLSRYLPERVLSFPTSSVITPKIELQLYLLGALGSPQRLDYGTGHELSFLAFLGCIWKLGGFNSCSAEDEERGIVLGIIEP